MKEINLLQIPETFFDQFPDLRKNPIKVEKYYERYLDFIRQTLVEQLPYIESNSFSLNETKADDYCSSFNYKRKKYHIWNLFKKLQPIIVITNKGNNVIKKISTVQIKENHIEQLLDTISPLKIIKNLFGDATDFNQIEFIKIDITSLSHFILEADNKLLHSQGTYESKIICSKWQAKQFLSIANYFLKEGITTEPSLPHVSKLSPYGRNYYQGLSLHNCTREVRRAVIGNHFQYDLDAAVYAVRLMTAELIFQQFNKPFSGNFTYTEEYLDYKKGIRKRLAKYIQSYPDPIKLVKDAITAIGFGAKLNDSTWIEDGVNKFGSISRIIQNPSDRKAFITDPWLVKFAEEQKILSNLIKAYLLSDNDIVNNAKNVPNILDKKGKFITNKLMTWFYQSMETMVVNEMSNGLPILVKIHDAIISLKPLKKAELNLRLKSISRFLTCSEEFVRGYYNEKFDLELQAEIEDDNKIKAKLGLSTQVVKAKIVKPEKKFPEGFYDSSHDDGSRHDNADPNIDSNIEEMTREELLKHIAIFGSDSNNKKLPPY